MKADSGYKNYISFAAVLGFLILVVLLSGCSQEHKVKLIEKAHSYDPYPQTVAKAFPGVEKARTSDIKFSELTRGNIIECFDVQAVPAIEKGVGTYWYPHCLATVIIAVDRDQTDASIKGWHDLFKENIPVGWNHENQIREMMLGALFYGLEGRNYTSSTGISMMRKQYEDHHFIENDWNMPVMVCMDYQAVSLIQSGRNLEIIVPEEGTLSFEQGLLSRQLLNTVSDMNLLTGGLRLADGRCINQYYPSQEQYAPAERVENYDRFLETTAYSIRMIRRQVRHTRLYSAADGQEDVLYAIFAITMTLIWMATATHRAIRKDVKRAVQIIAMAIVGWLMVRLFKYRLIDMGIVNRICWYSYYIFQLALPLTMLYISSIFDRPESSGKPPRWFYPFLIVYPILIITVFTNDFHNWVFKFDINGNWSDNYTYGIGYFIVYGYCILTFLLSVIFLIKKSWKSPNKRGWYLPLLVGIMLIIYATSYNQNIAWARDSDFTTTFCMFCILFFEGALSTGLIPSNRQYSLLFISSPMNMQLLDSRGKTILAGSAAAELEPIQRVQLQSKDSVSINKDEDTVLFSHKIEGGTVVWQEDIGPMNRLHQEVQDSVERLKAANSLLRKEGAIRRQKMETDVRVQLFTSLEQEIEEKTAELSKAIQTLPQAADREQQVAYITLLLCHIKRRCNLFFLTQEGRQMAGDELAIYLDELSEFAGYAGIRALSRCGIAGMLDIRKATLCYDFYFTILAWSVQKSRATLLAQLEQKDGALDFRILSSEETGTLIFSEPFMKAVENLHGSCTCRMLEETAGIYLSFPKGGPEDD